MYAGDVCAVCADCGFDAGDAVSGFSLRVLPEADFQKVKDALALREKCLPEILKAVECAKVTGEPIVRSMEFVFLDRGWRG